MAVSSSRAAKESYAFLPWKAGECGICANDAQNHPLAKWDHRRLLMVVKHLAPLALLLMMVERLAPAASRHTCSDSWGSNARGDRQASAYRRCSGRKGTSPHHVVDRIPSNGYVLKDSP